MYNELSLEEIIELKNTDNEIFQKISFNKNLTLNFIESHIHEDWDFETLTHHEIITNDFILNHKSKSWNFNYYRFLKTLTLKQLNEVQDKIEDYETLSRNHNIVLEYIFDHSEKNWCWFEISKRPDISQDFVCETKPLNFYLLYKIDNKIYHKADFLAEHKNRIMIDFEDYIEHLSVYEKIKEQQYFIESLLLHI